MRLMVARSLWIQPTSAGPVAANPPAGIAGAAGEVVSPQIDGTAGDSRLQNDWQLEYHPDTEYFVLRLANATIEHTNDLGVSAPVDDQDDRARSPRARQRCQQRPAVGSGRTAESLGSLLQDSRRFKIAGITFRS